MVSFWPFKGDSNNAASFEKELKQLSTKITKATTHYDRLRSNQRRFKALWTLYTSFAYILVAAILTLVTGWDKWSAPEYTAVAGGPVLIFGVRTAIDAYYNFRLSKTQDHLNDLNKQREAAIKRLKEATKYDSTAELLEKYGGSPSSRKGQPSPQIKGKRKSDVGPGKPSTPQAGRTGLPPPPTANVPRTGISPPPTANVPQNQPPRQSISPDGASPSANNLGPPPRSPDQSSFGEDFAPNAFTAARQPTLPPTYAEAPKWYDRILDVVLGEDEGSSKNRIALICQNCRLVNGQAPPGARTLEDVGRWRCRECHAWNGVDSEEKQILQRISDRRPELPEPMSAATDPGPLTKYEEDEDDLVEVENEEEAIVDTPPAASTRSKAGRKA